MTEGKQARKKIFKVLVAGPFGAGKTTFVKSVSTLFIGTDRKISFMPESRFKKTTTIAFDTGLIRRPDYMIRIYGTPGQERFFYMIPPLIEKSDYLLFMVDSTAVSHVARGRRMFDKYFRDVVHRFKNYLIAANKRDLPNKLPLEEVSKIMYVEMDRIVELIAFNKIMCIQVLKRLLNYDLI